MKKSIILIFIAPVVVLLSFRSDKMSTVAPSLSYFDAIELNTHITTTITIQEGATPGIKLSGSEADLAHITMKVVNNKLIISNKDRGWQWNDEGPVTAEIVLSHFTMFDLSGSSEVTVHGNIAEEKFKMDISGSGKVLVDNMRVSVLTSDVSGSGSFTPAAGNVKNAKFEISGSGKIRAFDLHAEDVSAEIAGSGKCEVNAEGKLSAEISGSGSVIYRGKPQSVQQNITGSGSVRRAE